MPLYEYSCDHCEEQFEVIQSPTDTEEVVCPNCNEPARKLISGFAIRGSISRVSGSCGTSGGWGGG